MGRGEPECRLVRADGQRWRATRPRDQTRTRVGEIKTRAKTSQRATAACQGRLVFSLARCRETIGAAAWAQHETGPLGLPSIAPLAYPQYMGMRAPPRGGRRRSLSSEITKEVACGRMCGPFSGSWRCAMTAKETRLPVPPGSVIAGRYRLDHVIGIGGMGIVVAATHLQLEQPIAIKFLQPDALASSEVVARFIREARAAVRIKSEHVARVLDVGALESGAPYMVMERLEGNDLAALLRSRGRFSLDTVVDYVLQALDAIAEAHSLGIVHRDLKPANLFLASGRRAELVKVLDFGISKTISATGSAGSGMTEPTAVFGTPAYMSPEQLNSARDVDARADIWSLGIILYELLAGQAPFRADTVPQLCVAIMNHPTPALRMIRGDVPPGFEVVIERCLQKERQQRYASAEELALALAEFAPPHCRALLDRFGRKEVARAVASSRPSGDTLTAPPAQVRSPTLGEDSTQSEWGGTSRGFRPPVRRALVVAITLAGVIAGTIAAIGFARKSATTAELPVLSNAPGPAAEPTASQLPSSGKADPSSAAGATRTNVEMGEPAGATTRDLATEQPPVSPRSSSEKATKMTKPRPGAAAKTPPAASSGRTPEPRKGTSERWEDER